MSASTRSRRTTRRCGYEGCDRARYGRQGDYCVDHLAMDDHQWLCPYCDEELAHEAMFYQHVSVHREDVLAGLRSM